MGFTVGKGWQVETGQWTCTLTVKLRELATITHTRNISEHSTQTHIYTRILTSSRTSRGFNSGVSHRSYKLSKVELYSVWNTERNICTYRMCLYRYFPSNNNWCQLPIILQANSDQAWNIGRVHAPLLTRK